MTFMEHLEELRQRLIKCLVAVIAGVLVCWFFREELRQFLEAPLYAAWNSVPGLPAPSPLSFTSLMEPFVAYLKIAAIGGIFFASPVIFLHLWRFVSPGLYKKEKRMALPFVFISSVLFIVGSAGAYAYVFPIGFSFFLQFSSGGTTEVYESGQIVLVEQVAPKAKAASRANKRIESFAENDSVAADSEEVEDTSVDSNSIDDTSNTAGNNDSAPEQPIDGSEKSTDGSVSSVDGNGVSKKQAKMQTGEMQESPKSARRKNETKKNQPSAESLTSVQKSARKSTHEKGRSAKVSTWEKAGRLYAWVAKKLVGASCGRFDVVQKTNDVVLRYRHSLKRCGQKPVAFQLERNDESLALKMLLLAEKNGWAIYEARDNRVTTGTVSYRLSAVREASQKLLPVLMVKDYLDFAVKLMLAFGLVFELPILIFFLAYAGIVDYMQLIRFGRWFVVLSLTMAAILTPPDVVTQILLATPLVVLYYLSIVVVFFLGRKRKRSE